MAYNRPVQVFTDIKQVKNPEKNFIVTHSENMNVMSNKESNSLDRQINVTGIGEMELPPDRFSLTIKCKATKDNISDAKTSVTRRIDYIMQTLKNANLKEEDCQLYQHINYQESAAVCESQVEAHFVDLAKCLSVSNVLVEKLSHGVTISLPVCYHAKGSLDKLRKQVGMLAIHNARQKAQEMAKVIHMSVGSPVQVQEDDFIEYQGSTNCDVEELELSSGIRQRLTEKTIKMRSKVSVCFQLKSNNKKNKYR